MSSPPRRLRRRDFLALSVVGVGGAALIKVGGRWVIGASDPPGSPDLSGLLHLSQRQARIVTAAALAMVGPAAEEAFVQGKWSPARGVDDLLGRLASDQRSQLGVALHLLEEWTVGLRGFSSWSREDQRALLARWRTSSLGLHRSVWGFLHAATASTFSGSEAGWEVMGYPGPCVGLGRSPGQTAIFEWDERVP